MKTTRIQNGKYKVEHNGDTFIVKNVRVDGKWYWDTFQVKYGAEIRVDVNEKKGQALRLIEDGYYN